MNLTLTDMISMYIDEKHQNWDEILPFVTFAYNSSVQETTGYSPYFLIHGREPLTFLDSTFDWPEVPPKPGDFDDYISNLLTIIEESKKIKWLEQWHGKINPNKYTTNIAEKLLLARQTAQRINGVLPEIVYILDGREKIRLVFWIHHRKKGSIDGAPVAPTTAYSSDACQWPHVPSCIRQVRVVKYEYVKYKFSYSVSLNRLRSEMPPKKRKPIGKVLPEVSKKRNVRSAETAVQREHRLRINRERASTSRAAESVGQRENRLQQDRDKASTSRAAESLEQRENRLRQKRNRVSTSRAAETPQEHTARILNVRERTLASRNSRDRLSNLLLGGFNYDSCKNYEQHPSITIGQMSIVCNYCKAKKFKDEPPGFCCKNGKVYLSPPQLPPDELFSLMSGNSSESNHFLRNIRKYNSCFQMTSFGATSFSEESVFPTTFRAQGQVYHRAGSLLPSLDQPPQFLQIFFVEDAQLEVNQRCHFSSALRHGTVLCLQRMFHRCNQLIKIFKTALENMPSDEYKLVIRADKTPSGEHERHFNAPQSNDVAVVLSADEFNQRDIIIQRRSNALKRISETHRSYDPLQYPIIFWDGEDGYHFNYRQIDQNTGVPTNRKVSAMSFYSYRIMARDNVYNHILNCRQLFSQYIVDMYAKIESERLLYIRLNQKELRVEEYIHLRDAVSNDGMVANFGKLVILPATFTGSPRHMHEYTQDAMVFVRTYGRPDLFITFTCNPSWPEINAELFNGQKPMDRHDLTARVFKLKLNKF
ncbi:hypothetical protein LAZ67_11001135 [Cordylochernes scorpioides]|uniref:Helitron helicase-like domain-containing protein n=1 Tax=Cordylochernes scorpioides TaxID=51811 RepID=A0ABY6L238_9ARAC|nr:hypothetical protein LAZ67_11001135 [Cordylochernes scorpioides]